MKIYSELAHSPSWNWTWCFLEIGFVRVHFYFAIELETFICKSMHGFYAHSYDERRSKSPTLIIESKIWLIKSRCAFLIANISSPKSFPWRNDAATFDFHFRVQTENYWNFEAGSPLRVVKVNWISSIYDPATLKLHVATFRHSERVKTFHNWYENEKDFWGDRAT